MSLTAATGYISEMEELCRLTLADSARWRTWCDAADQDEALEHIYIDAITLPTGRQKWTAKELTALRPYALVYIEPHTRHTIAVSSYAKFSTVHLIIHDAVDPDNANDPSEIGRLFKNNYGTVLDEMCVLANQGGYMPFREVQIAQSWERTPPEQRKSDGDAVAIEFLFTVEVSR